MRSGRARYSLRDGAGDRAIAATATAARATSTTFRATSSHTGPRFRRDEIPVAGREPQLREYQCRCQQPRRRETSPPSDEGYDGDEPQEELRRDHLAERDERAQRGRPARDELLPRAAAHGEEPRRRRRRPPDAVRVVPRASGSAPFRFCEPKLETISGS